MSATTEFELEGMRFEVKRLSPDDACLGLEVLNRAIGPALIKLFLSRSTEPETPPPTAPASDVEGEAPPDSTVPTISNELLASLAQSLLSQASQISVLVNLFAKRTKFDRLRNGRMVELKPFLDIFEGRVDLMVAYLFHACLLYTSDAADE